MGRYEGCMESPWDDISIQYVLVCTHVAKKRYVEAFKEESQLVTSVTGFFFGVSSYNDHFCRLFLRFFTENRGWTLPALFSILRDLRDLAFDVGRNHPTSQIRWLIFWQADHHAKYNGQKSECMEESARIIAKAFGNCMTDRYPHSIISCISNPHRTLIGYHHLINPENGEFIMSLV